MPLFLLAASKCTMYILTVIKIIFYTMKDICSTNLHTNNFIGICFTTQLNTFCTTKKQLSSSIESLSQYKIKCLVNTKQILNIKLHAFNFVRIKMGLSPKYQLLTIFLDFIKYNLYFKNTFKLNYSTFNL